MDLVQQLQGMNIKLDELISRSQMKQQLHDKKSAVVTYEYACGHESEIIAMKRKIE